MGQALQSLLDLRQDSAVPHSSATELYPGLAAMTSTSGPTTATGSTWLRRHARFGPDLLDQVGPDLPRRREIQWRRIDAGWTGATARRHWSF